MRRRWYTVVAVGIALGVGPAPAAAQGLLPPLPLPLGGPPPEAGVPQYANPVVQGDYPDPAVIRDGPDYWGVVTSGGWRPPFTMLHSRDLVNWQVAGAVMRKPPSWASSAFWAPEIVKVGGRYLVYYAARKRRGGHCVAVATGQSPLGFFRDRGPLTCPRLGAIDPLPTWDQSGRPYLLWKIDGAPTHQPTPILAAPLSASGQRIAGSPRELIRNDARWEGGGVEGPSLARHAGKLYLFYSGGACCGPPCNYQVGVARSSSLLGPWEKHHGPILSGNARFRCPGHSTVVDGPGGGQYLLYHAYGAGGPLGRQVLLDRLSWGSDGWPTVGDGHPSTSAPSPGGARQLRRPLPFRDEFDGRFLTPGWQWRPPRRPALHLDGGRGGRLWLGTVRKRRLLRPGSLGWQPGQSSFTAETLVSGRRRGAKPGIAAYADGTHAMGLELQRRRVVLWRASGGNPAAVASRSIPPAEFVDLRIRSHGGTFSFEVRTRADWVPVGAPRYQAPTWTDETRVVLRVRGPRRAHAAFERFKLNR
jgi:xylan 1,4-beta-xylosidase